MMQFISDNIVYIWLVPVVLQIVLPLAMLAVWSIKKVIALFSIKKEETAQRMRHFANSGIKPIEKAA
jgi:hypothetical protein